MPHTSPVTVSAFGKNSLALGLTRSLVERITQDGVLLL